MADLNWKKSGLFAAGVLFGTAGIKALSSKDAKKLLYQLHSSCSSRKGLRYEDSYYSSGKLR